METEGGGHPNPSNAKLSKSGSAGVALTLGNVELPCNLRARAPAPRMPSTALQLAAADDRDNGASSSNKPTRNRGKVQVDDSGSSTNAAVNNNGKSSSIAPPAPQQGEEAAAAPREQDRYLPIANVIRLMRKILPTHAKISDDTKESVQECVSEFIGFITSEANERCRLEQRKTITAEDLLCSMAKLGFDDYIAPLTLYLQRYRDAEGSVRGSLRGDHPLPAPIKRTASDAGLYMPPPHQPPPPPAAAAYPFVAPCSSSQNPCILHPQAFFPGGGVGGGSSFAAVEQGQPPMAPSAMINYLFGDMQLPTRPYRAGAAAPGELGVVLQPPPRAYRAGAAYGEGPPAPAAFRDAHMYMDMTGAPSTSSQAADPSQQATFVPGFDPYSPNK